jgi:zinc protease
MKKLVFLAQTLFFLILGVLMEPNFGFSSLDLTQKVKVHTLSSGLKVLFFPYQRERVVTVKLCVKVGSNYEWDEVAGITHLIEHMIFKGTEHKKPEDISGAVEAKGGYINAFTSYDYTCYYVSGPTEVFETALDVLSEAVFHPIFDPNELSKEKEVVVEEMKMRLDNPYVVLYEELMKKSYTKYPYRRPIIGFENTVRSLTRDDLFYFVNHFYTPENMVLVIVGNLPYDEVLKLSEKYFSNLPKRTLKQVVFPTEPYVEKPTLSWVERKVKEGYFALSFPAPSLKENDAPLADLLAEVLGGGETSRLYLRLKRELNLVKSISASALTPSGPGLFKITGTADPQNFHPILRETLKEVLKIKHFGLSEEELRRAKTQVLSSFIYGQESTDGLSRTLATFELIRGTYKDIDWYVKQIERATPEDLQRLAEKIFNPSKLTVVFLSEKALFGEEELRKIVEKEVLLEEAQVFRLKNNLKVILKPQKETPTVGLALVFPGGVRFENKGNNGLFQALTLIWTRGTKKRSAEEISQTLENLGSSIVGYTGRNTFGLKALSLSKNLDQTLELFSEILFDPSFSEEECEKAKPELMSMLHRQEDQPLSLALKEFLEFIFPDHPYGLNQAGSQAFYQSFTCEDLRKAYQDFVNLDQATLVVVGDFDPVDLKLKLKKYFEKGALRKEEKREEPEPLLPKPGKRFTPKESFQTQVLLGFVLPGLLSPERPTIEVLNSIFSGMESRLFRTLRDERSLAYAVTSFLVMYPKASIFTFYIACSPEKTDQAVAGFFEILEKISSDGLTQEEIERGKNRLLGRYRLSLQSNIAKAEDMALNEVLGLGWDYQKKYEEEIKKVDAERLKDIIKKYLKKDRAYLLILGPNVKSN